MAEDADLDCLHPANILSEIADYLETLSISIKEQER
jgi:hypothetical protein